MNNCGVCKDNSPNGCSYCSGHSCTYLGHIDGETHRKALAEIEALRAELKRWEDEDKHESMECYAENMRLRKALKSIVADFPDTRAGMTAADALKDCAPSSIAIIGKTDKG